MSHVARPARAASFPRFNLRLAKLRWRRLLAQLLSLLLVVQTAAVPVNVVAHAPGNTNRKPAPRKRQELKTTDAAATGEKVVVTLKDKTFYAELLLLHAGSRTTISSRPSDAIALAVRCQAPIFAAEEVIDESSIEFEHEVEDQEEVVERFKDFLDEVSPEDFAGGSDEPPPDDPRA